MPRMSSERALALRLSLDLVDCLCLAAGLALGAWSLPGTDRRVPLALGLLVVSARRAVLPPPELPARGGSVLGTVSLLLRVLGSVLLFLGLMAPGTPGRVYGVALAGVLLGDNLDRSLRFAAALREHPGEVPPPRRLLPSGLRLGVLVAGFAGAALTALWMLGPGRSPGIAGMAILVAGALMAGVWAHLWERAYARDFHAREARRELDEQRRRALVGDDPDAGFHG